MDIHNLTIEEKKKQYHEHMGLDFPKNYAISFGDYNCNRRCRMCPMYNEVPKDNRYMKMEALTRALEEFGSRKAVMEFSAFGRYLST